MRVLPLIVLLLAAASPASAQYVVPADRAELLDGKPAGETAYAVFVGYPTRERLLEFKEQLGLTRDQLRKMDAITRDEPVALKVKGEEIVEAEDALLKLMQTGTANERTVRTHVEKIGKLRADLRFMQLQVFLRLKALLTPNQAERYKELVTASPQ